MQLQTLVNLSLLFPLTTHALSYWISPTCNDGTLAHSPPRDGVSNSGRWDSLFQEIRDAAESGSNRLSNQQATDFSRAFHYIFATDDRGDYSRPIGSMNPSAASIKLWLTNLQSIVATTQILSDVRIYCDNDARWVPKNDGEGWKDVANHISIDEKPHCLNGKGTLGVTYRDNNEEHGGHNPNRASMTLCKDLFDAANDAGHWLWSDIPKEKDFSADERSIQWIRNAVTSTVVHELSHTWQFDTDDVRYGGGKAYGWQAVTDLGQPDSLDNADNWMYIVVMSMFLDRGFALDRDDADAQAQGRLVHYDNIGKAKRWISRVNRWMSL